MKFEHDEILKWAKVLREQNIPGLERLPDFLEKAVEASKEMDRAAREGRMRVRK
jgi:hypothetical protein